MKKVYICSPCRGDYENNIQRAKEYSRAAVEKSVILELADRLISDPGVHIEIGG